MKSTGVADDVGAYKGLFSSCCPPPPYAHPGYLIYGFPASGLELWLVAEER